MSKNNVSLQRLTWLSLNNIFLYLPDGSLDIVSWLDKIKINHSFYESTILNQTVQFIQSLTKGLTTFYGQPCLEHGLNTAELLLGLKLDENSIAAGIVSSSLTNLTPNLEEKVKKTLGESIAKLVIATKQTNLISSLSADKNQIQSDKIRKMLLTMAADIRVVVIKLAERLAFMHGIKHISLSERKKYAHEILDIYAPLANRLGIGQLKWELEDIAFHYLNPTLYKTIASFLAERRIDREIHIQQLIQYLHEKLTVANIASKISGRAKHIYSIYLKSQRKDLNYQDIYDSSAIRVLVSTIEDCYKVLSLVHSLWQPIMAEFDDYIAHPKPNGYQSIHTAVVGENNKHFEIQIRTYAMHEESEHGIAAHWVYKENKTSVNDKLKITYLRQLLDWQKDLTPTDVQPISNFLLNEQIYVITPAGDILDLPQGSTPIDFAYHIHTELGHRCRGAKVNGQIVPLTYRLQTGDKVELIVIPQGHPSRDWLNSELGYIKSARAKSKIHHWFKQQALKEDIETGKEMLEKELNRQGLSKTISLATIAKQFQLKNEESLLVSLARGNIRVGQVLQIIMPKTNDTPAPVSPHLSSSFSPKNYGNAIVGANDFMTRLAKCCKPIPGDLIMGYITQGRGISIHKKNCNNISNIIDKRRFIDINWEEKHSNFFSTDLNIVAQDHDKVLQDLTSLLANEKIVLLKLNFNFNKNQQKIFISATVQIQGREQLQRLLQRIQHLPRVLEVTRII